MLFIKKKLILKYIRISNLLKKKGTNQFSQKKNLQNERSDVSICTCFNDSFPKRKELLD